MSMIVCPECKKKVSSEAKSCPKCGYPLDKIDHSIMKEKNESIYYLLILFFGIGNYANAMIKNSIFLLLTFALVTFLFWKLWQTKKYNFFVNQWSEWLLEKNKKRLRLIYILFTVVGFVITMVSYSK